MYKKISASIGLILFITITNYLSILLLGGYKNGYLFLSVAFFLLILIGLRKNQFLSLFYVLSIPIVGRMISLSVPFNNSFLQILLLTLSMLILGIFGSKFFLKKHFVLPTFSSCYQLFKYLVIGILIGVMTWFMTLNAPLIFPNAYLQIAFLVLITVSEEIVFRGLILKEAVKNFHPITAVLATSILYGSLYTLSDPSIFLLLYFISMLVSYLYLHDHKIWLTILLGVTWKIVSLLSPSLTLF